MKILTKNNVIIEISYKADIVSNGIKLDNYILAISVENDKFTEELPKIFDVDQIPTEVKAYKYCYTEEKGFYINNEYNEEPSKDTIERLQQDNEEMKQAIAELTTMIATGGAQ